MATHSSILAWRMPMDRGAWGATGHGVTKSLTPLSNFHFPPICLAKHFSVQFSSVQSLSRVLLFATP